MNAPVSNFAPTTAHAIYSMSGAHVWIKCTASATAVAAMGHVIQQEDGEDSVVGTAAHDEIDRVLGVLNDVSLVGGGDFIALVNEQDGDQAAAFGIALFVDYAYKLATEMPGKFWIEKHVRLTDDIWGRLDLAHWHAESATVTIADYKNGFVGVDAEKNDQFRGYAAALIRQFNLPAKHIRYACVQPNDFRPGPRVKQWHESIESLNAWTAEVEGIPDGPLTFTFGAHCRDCPLLGICKPTRDLLPQLGAVMSRGPAGDVPAHLIPLFLALKKPIDHFFEGLLKGGTKRALAGDVPPGMLVVTAQKHRVWISEQAAREAVYAAKGLSGLKPPTPAQAEEMGINIEGLADKPKGGPVLAFANDKRKPWEPATAEQMFAGIPGVRT